MKTAKTIGKAAVLALVFTGLFAACQSTGDSQSTDSQSVGETQSTDSQSTGEVQKNSEAVQAFERAEAFYKRGAFKEAIAEYTKAIELEPEWAQAFLGRGNARVWGLDSNMELGQEDYDRAAALDPQYRDFAQAVKYTNDGDLLRAIETFDMVIKNNINLMDAYSYRGNLYHLVGDFDKAISDNTEAIRLNPDFPGNYTNRAYAYNETGRYDMAIADCDGVINLYPDNFYAYLFRGEAHYRKGNSSKALDDINSAIQLNPDNRGGSAFYPYHIRATIYQVEGNYSRAIPDYSQVIRFLPDNPSLYIDRGYCYLRTGDYDRATADIDTALRLDPGNETALWLRDEIRAAR